MEFSFTEEQNVLRNSVRDLMQRECTPEYARRCDEDME